MYDVSPAPTITDEMAPQTNGHPSWRSVLMVIGTAFGMIVGVNWVILWAILGIHSQQPHLGAAKMNDVNLIRQEIQVFRQEVRSDLREIRDELRED